MPGRPGVSGPPTFPCLPRRQRVPGRRPLPLRLPLPAVPVAKRKRPITDPAAAGPRRGGGGGRRSSRPRPRLTRLCWASMRPWPPPSSAARRFSSMRSGTEGGRPAEAARRSGAPAARRSTRSAAMSRTSQPPPAAPARGPGARRRPAPGWLGRGESAAGAGPGCRPNRLSPPGREAREGGAAGWALPSWRYLGTCLVLGPRAQTGSCSTDSRGFPPPPLLIALVFALGSALTQRRENASTLPRLRVLFCGDAVLALEKPLGLWKTCISEAETGRQSNSQDQLPSLSSKRWKYLLRKRSLSLRYTDFLPPHTNRQSGSCHSTL